VQDQYWLSATIAGAVSAAAQGYPTPKEGRLRRTLNAVSSSSPPIDTPGVVQFRYLRAAAMAPEMKLRVLRLSCAMSLMYLNVLAAANLLFLSATWVCMEGWIEALDGGSVAALEQKKPPCCSTC